MLAFNDPHLLFFSATISELILGNVAADNKSEKDIQRLPQEECILVILKKEEEIE